MSDTQIHYDTQYQLYKRQRYDYTAKTWTFIEWMPRGWTPAPPAEPTPSQQHPQVPKTPTSSHARADSAYTGSSPVYSPTYGSGVTQSPGTATQATPAAQTSHARIQETYSATYGRQPISPPQWRATSTYAQQSGSTPNYPTQYSHSQQHQQGQHHQQAQSRSVSDRGTSLPRGTGLEIVGAGDGKDYARVDKKFRLQNKNFFVEGRVLAMIMNETAGENSRSATDYNSAQSGARNVDSNLTPVKYKDNLVHTQTRRFVIVRQRKEFAFACPIFTYSGRATLKGGVRPAEHGVVYSLGQPPQLLAGETGITKPSIGVRMTPGESDLNVASRIYYGIHHPIQYNVKVKNIGRVPAEHITQLIANWKEEDDKDELSRVNEENDEIQNPPDSGVDRYLYHPINNPYGYDATRSPNAYHPIYNPFGYHPEYNSHGYHPTSNPFSYHPKHNAFGFHPSKAPFCYHPIFSPHGYHNTENPLGYHPATAPHSYHPDVNPQGYHPTHSPNSYHPTHNPNGVQYESDDESSDEEEETYVTV